MNKTPYPFTRVRNKYLFTSHGNTSIVKRVEFTSMGLPDIYNVGFGDVLPDGTIDDESKSNNGDMFKVLVTVVHIIKDFLNKYPKRKIFFTGSTQSRTSLYNRILRMYHIELGASYIITMLVRKRHHTTEIIFDPVKEISCIGFFVRKK
jgi:hypothetical protein